MGVLSCPPSGIVSERLFSAAGGIITPKQRRLSASNVEKLTFTKINQAWILNDSDCRPYLCFQQTKNHLSASELLSSATNTISTLLQSLIPLLPSTRVVLVFKENNMTLVSMFFLLGFQINRDLRISLFCLLLLIFCGTICGNLLIIALVSTSKNLHTPMYFFISHLSISDILLSTDIVPNLFHILLNNGGTMTFIGCIAQLCFFCFSEVFECLLLAVMSYDRYVAICNPLRYSSIMTSRHCVISTIICCLFGFFIALFYVITMVKLNFCGHNMIDHIFCDIVPLLDLACSDTFFVQLEIYVIGFPAVFIPTTIIVVSYTYIILAILRIPSNTGRQKAFSTCSSHLIVVSIFYGTIFSVYIVPTKGRTLSMSKILSLLYTVFTPLVNPIIYSLRNNDIKKTVRETYHKWMI
ncbi:olfactory receptor 1009-like [Hyla sarda]|uniref:olfactory receptor 1009-like n=1 Tax=Hyla sarda TaxID=327740 RepID=UPI0024C228F0|nr:olfactory receptor 1009-like [Hyla sarda]